MNTCVKQLNFSLDYKGRVQSEMSGQSSVSVLLVCHVFPSLVCHNQFDTARAYLSPATSILETNISPFCHQHHRSLIKNVGDLNSVTNANKFSPIVSHQHHCSSRVVSAKNELRFVGTRLTWVIKFESTLDGSVGALWI